MSLFRAGAWLFGLLLAGGAAASPPPLERHGYSRLTDPGEIVADLRALGATPGARLEILGQSVEGRDIAALVFEPATDAEALTLFIVGSQHGASEPAGAETLLALAHALAAAPPDERRLRYVLVPDANPDGRALRRRANAKRVNLNTDYVALTQPESRALLAAVQRFRPEVVLDVHESAVLKRESLGREGYLTDFDAQFESANNPALPAEVTPYARDVLLPEIVARVAAAGLPAQRYLAEIRSTRQPVTNGGLSLRNLRNRAAVGGAASFLLETRLEPRRGGYPSYRNIAARVARQRLCLEQFVAVVGAHDAEIRRRVALARGNAPRTPLPIDAAYGPDPAHPRVTLGLRRLADGQRVSLGFADHRRVVSRVSAVPALTYLVTDHVGTIRDVLERQGLRCTLSQAPGTAEVVAFRTGTREGRLQVRGTRRRTLVVPAGSLYIELAQPEGRLLPLLLDPRSTSSLFQEPGYADLGGAAPEFFVYGVYDGVTAAAGRAR